MSRIINQDDISLSISAARQIILQALTGLDHLHGQRIVHGDFYGVTWVLELQDKAPSIQ